MKKETRRVEDLSEDEYANYEAHPEEWLDVTELTNNEDGFAYYIEKHILEPRGW